jgi:arylsulfatase A-like enzyme
MSVKTSGGSSDRTSWRAWLAAGLAGGALGGAVDAVVAIVGGIGGLDLGKALRLVVLAASLVAVAGGLEGLLLGLGGWLAGRTRHAERWAAGLAAAAAAPLIGYDAFAMFSGHQAAALPAHGAISIGLLLAGMAATALAARAYRRTLALPVAPAGARIGLVLLALAAQAANHWVLPRLYPWFHTTLSVVTVTALVLAVRLSLRRTTPRGLLMALVATTGAFAGAVLEVRGSQVMRYATHERTALASLVLRGVPVGVARPPRVAAARRADVDLPPLPDGPRRPDADVLVITIDALRADHVGAYGYRRGTTPAIDALAASGARFSRAYAQAPHTSFSIGSMMTGKYFATLARLAPGEYHEPVAAVLRTYGWRTAAFYPPAVFYVDAKKLKAYADRNFDFEYVKFEYIDAQRRVDQVLDYYRDVKPAKSFVWVHFFEPHEPYEAHEGFAYGAGDVDRYDSEIAYTDAAVGRLIETVRAQRPGTVVVVAADHGEEFDEHGGRYHGSTLYDEQLRIPLIVAIPGVAPRVLDGQVELIDVAPTILNLLDIPVPARMRGTDLGPWLAPRPAPAARLPPAFAEVEDQRMIVLGGEKLLCDLHWGFCAYYDLAADPGERDNLAEKRPERAAALRSRLDDWLNDQVRLEPLLSKGAGGPDGGLLPRAIERGRLGDLLAASELAALVGSSAPRAQRREAIELLVALPPRPAETTSALLRAVSDPDRVIADWAAVGAVRLGDGAARPRVQALAADAKTPPRLRVRAALALASVGDPAGMPVLGDALEHCEDMALCRTIIVVLGKLRDRQAVPILLAHLREVLNRREMVEALGEIADPSTAGALLERLRSDEYVPVRVAAARALARLGDPGLAPEIDRALRKEREPVVVAAGREAAAALRAAKP